MPGSPGLDGRDGIPGEPGLDGVPGNSLLLIYRFEWTNACTYIEPN